MRDIGGVGGHHLVWGGPQRGYLDNGKSRTSTGTVCHQSPGHQVLQINMSEDAPFIINQQDIVFECPNTSSPNHC